MKRMITKQMRDSFDDGFWWSIFKFGISPEHYKSQKQRILILRRTIK